MAVKALEQEPCEDEYIKVPKKALKYRTAGMVAYNAEWLKNHFDIERAVICGAQEPCEDVISRKSIKQKLKEHHDFFVDAYGGFSNLPQNDKSRVDELTNCIAMVVNEPSVIPQPKTGRWVDDKCSVCGKGIEDLIDSSEWYRNEKPNFCPFCGLKLIEPQKSDLGDYPDAIHNQFDNMTGSMNL